MYVITVMFFQALLSAYDKTDLLAKGLAGAGVRLLGSGGTVTAKKISEGVSNVY
jgi:AICAR transformylase/IMP cyclohydrolase PurH